MATRAEELAKILGSPRYIISSISRNSNSLTTGGISGFIWPIVATIFLLFLILLVVHYTVTPIFTFSFGDTGLLPLADTSDGQLVWTKAPVAADLSANVLRILPNSFTISMDIFVENTTTLSSVDRVVFYRAMRPVTPNTTKTLMEQYPESNVLVRLLPDTNDLVISAITLQDPMNPLTATLESAPTILNVPVRQPFRISIVLFPQVLEVYLNGRLFGTKTFRYALKSAPAYFFGPPELFRNSVRVMNVQYWDRGLTSVEIRKAGPALTDTSLFGGLALPTASCS